MLRCSTLESFKVDTSDSDEKLDLTAGRVQGGRFVDKIDENKRLRFAERLLVGIAGISIFVFIAYGRYPENGALQQIFELVKIGLLPLATLIISFYFARTDH